MAVTRHQRMSLPSASIIDPVIVPFQVAGGGCGRRSKGNRRPDGWRGQKQFSGLRSRPSGPWCGYLGAGSGTGAQSSSHFRWRVAAPGGRWRAICPLSSVIDAVIYSALYSALHAVLYSALPLSLPIRQPLSANRHHLLRLLAFPPPTPIPTPIPSLHSHVLPLHSSPSRRPDAA